jgi:signal transduction histidine kinase
MEDLPNAIIKFKESIELQKKVGPLAEIFASFSQLGNIFLRLGQVDSAFRYSQLGYDLGKRTTHYPQFYSLSIAALGNVYARMGHLDTARKLLQAGIEHSRRFGNIYFEDLNCNYLALLYFKMHLRDSCLQYAHRALRLSLERHFLEFSLLASSTLATLYGQENNADSSLKYTKITLAAKDSIFSQAKVREFQQIAYNEIQQLQQVNAEKERNQNRVRTYSLIAVLLLLSSLAYILYRNARQRQKDATSIQKAYNELKATQSQLIQSEKMASLGELTAGIAHEIQNPLNFVNNFSEVNQELFDEMETEFKNGNPTEAFAIASSIRQNLEKINQHGKRAESIVKGMLMHSRASSGQKESTDLNALADEYLRLSYHGMRAKDSSFNCEIRTEFDPALGRINLIPQDIGRVLMNLYNNSFYSLAEKLKKQGNHFEPLLIVRTSRANDKAEILIRDNGLGIAPEIKGKIFQPFFTTKPSGQGTGLGLSLSYDIISKEHSGAISVDSNIGEGAEFKIQLPFS